MRVRWFGESWGAPVCDPDFHVDAPVGKPCLACGMVFGPGDQGLAMSALSLTKEFREYLWMVELTQRPLLMAPVVGYHRACLTEVLTT